MTPRPPIAWTVAGSDSSGGAGIQADLKTFMDFGIHGCSVITAITAQNTRMVERSSPIAPDVLEAQFRALDKDLPPDMIKTGMLPTAGTIRTLAKFVQGNQVPLVTDPVAVSSSGTTLVDPAGWEALVNRLLPHVSLLTPNLHEAARLARLPSVHAENIELAASRILETGCHSVLIKGGHGSGETCLDYWSDGEHHLWLESPRLPDTGEVHGTGCILASALAAQLAARNDVPEALVTAKAYINQGIRQRVSLGKGAALFGHAGFPSSATDLPRVALRREELSSSTTFPVFTPPLDNPVYPIVDHAADVERMIQAGVRIIQLRLKNRPDLDPAVEVPEAVRIGKENGVPVIINDDWKTALACGAFGVHLGQDDLGKADLPALAKAGLVLGVSTHSVYEIARAVQIQPSYIAIGTVFKTTSKNMTWQPLGVERFARLRKLCPTPVVAIGGLNPARGREVMAAGADLCAVISDLAQAPDPGVRVAEWAATT